MTNTALIKVRRAAAQNAVYIRRDAAAANRPIAAASGWPDIKTLLEIGFAVVRVVELAMLLA